MTRPIFRMYIHLVYKILLQVTNIFNIYLLVFSMNSFELSRHFRLILQTTSHFNSSQYFF
jgi:hypothetical protein